MVLKQIRRYKIIHNKYQHRSETFAVEKVGALGVFPLMLQIHIPSEKTGRWMIKRTHLTGEQAELKRLLRSIIADHSRR